MAGAAFSYRFTTGMGRSILAGDMAWQDLATKQSIVPLQSDQVTLATGLCVVGVDSPWFTHPTADIPSGSLW